MNPLARNNRLIYAVIAVLAVIATLFGMSNGRILGVTPTVPTPTPTASAAAAAALSAPGLFNDADLEATGTLLDLQSERAATRIDDFYSDQPTGSTVDDPGFVTWASEQIPYEPYAGQRSRERAARDAVDRSGKRDAAAAWLGLHGCRDVWTSYVAAQKQFHAEDARVPKYSELDELLDLTVRAVTATQKRFSDDESATPPPPCTSRGPDADGCGCSFPSAPAAMRAAARTYLAALQPRSARQYAWMERQVDFAGRYQGLELRSDVEAGALLGYLAGRYFLASRGYGNLFRSPTPTPTAF